MLMTCHVNVYHPQTVASAAQRSGDFLSLSHPSRKIWRLYGLYLPPPLPRGTASPKRGGGVGLQLGGNLVNPKTKEKKQVVSMETVLGDEPNGLFVFH